MSMGGNMPKATRTLALGATLFLATILCLTGFSGCYPEGFDYVEELDTVLTWRSPGYDYSGHRTYDVPDEVVDLCSVDFDDLPPSAEGGGGAGGASGECEEGEHRFDDVILDSVVRNMEELGYERARLSDGETPDVVILAGQVASSTWFAYYAYPWWWYYGGYWGPYGYGPGWSTYYPGVPVAFEVPSGTIMLEMIALAEADDDQKKLPSIWVGTVHGLAPSTSSRSSIANRIEASIDQAFEQSPYLSVEER